MHTLLRRGQEGVVMYSKIHSGIPDGIDAELIEVETDISPGLPTLSLVGYLASSVKEAGDRVRAALKNTGFSIPPRRITVNLRPADRKKTGTYFDLAIAVSILLSMQVFTLKISTESCIFLGELGLNGAVMPVRGVLSVADAAKKAGYQTIFLSEYNVSEASLIPGIQVIGLKNLADALMYLDGEKSLSEVSCGTKPFGCKEREESSDPDSDIHGIDFSEIHGQKTAKTGMLVAAAGFHNILLSGEAGTGKSMMARALPGILPPLTEHESLTLTKLYSVAGMGQKLTGLIRKSPFRSPHSSIPLSSMVGGGNVPVPGEVSLATYGVLFLDEFPEFQREVIESLRQPLEDGVVTVSRLHGTSVFPARFMLVAARNECPCGYYPDRRKCVCSEREIREYQNRISHSLMDRIDVIVRSEPVKGEDFFRKDQGKSSRELKDMVVEARKRQIYRYRDEKFSVNADLPQRLTEKYIPLSRGQMRFLQKKIDEKIISARGYYRILRLARTVADLRQHGPVREEDLAEAFLLHHQGVEGKGQVMKDE